MNRIKIIVSDFDNTLFLHNINPIINKIILRRNLKSIKSFRKNGNIFVIATGRFFDSIYSEIIKYNITFDYLVCNYGAEIYDSKFNEIYLKPISNLDLKFMNESKYPFQYRYDAMKKNIMCATLYQFNDYIINELKDKLLYSSIEVKANKIKIYSNKVSKEDAIAMLFKKHNDIYTFGDDICDYQMLKEYNGFTLKNSLLSNTDIVKINKIYKKIEELNKIN